MKLHIYTYSIIAVLLFLVTINTAEAQKKNINDMTKEEILQMDYDDLLEMPFEDLLVLSDKVGVSADELLEMIMNRDIKSASKKAERAIESPLSTTVLSNEEIMASGATCIEEALRLAPGLIVREKSNGNFDVHIRGNDYLPSNNLMLYSENTISLIMIDGRPVFNYAHGGTFWETFPVDLNDIDRIEIIRGPSSALYGPNAVAGVINIITKSSIESKPSVEADIQGGTQSTIIANAGVGLPLSENFNVRISGNYQNLDRHSDLFYVWFQPQGAYVPFDSLGKTLIPSTGRPYVNGADVRFTDINTGKNKKAVNAFMNYKVNQDVNFDLDLGWQDSRSITTLLDNSNLAPSERLSTTKYLNFRGLVHGLSAQVSAMNGTQDAAKGNSGFNYDLNTFNAQIEYDWVINNLTLRPGISYQNTSYDDSDYLEEGSGEAVFNGKKSLSNSSFSLRADWKATDQLRLIAALRSETYSKPDKTYLTYQFVGSYKFNDNNLIRFVAARANRGPFMSDVFIHYVWDRLPIGPDGSMPYESIVYQGNENPKLMTMDNFEIGLRNKISSKVFSDIEVFYSSAKDFGSFKAVGTDPSPFNPYQQPFPPAHTFYYQYQNLDMVSHQLGVTFSFDYIYAHNLRFKLYGTFQQTKLKDYLNRNPQQSLEALIASSLGVPVPDDIMDISNNWTPTFYGGLICNYQPVEKLSLNANIYFLGEEDMIFQYESANVEPKTLVNLKASYKVWKDNAVYINVRNLFDDSDPEFPFMDETGRRFYAGLHLKF